ncbi:MAG: hypothetical protein AAFX85_18390, partial [Pseudomonadota bacterium]
MNTRAAAHALTLLLLPLASLPASAQTRTALALDEADIVATFVDGNDRVVGYEFTVGPDPIRITGLGFYDRDRDGLQQAHPVAIYRASDAAEIGIDLVEGGTAAPLRGNFRWEANIPFNLDANETYVIATLLEGNGDRWLWDPIAFGFGIATENLTVDAAISLSAHRR